MANVELNKHIKRIESRHKEAKFSPIVIFMFFSPFTLNNTLFLFKENSLRVCVVVDLSMNYFIQKK